MLLSPYTPHKIKGVGYMCCSQDASLGGARPADSLSRQLAVPLIRLVGELESPKGKTDPRGSSGRDNTAGRHHFWCADSLHSS